MRAIIIYFTGTFNTEYLARKIKEKLEYNNLYDATLFSIDYKSKIINLSHYDLVIFSYPIYAFNMPRIFEKYIKKLKFITNQTYIIAKQSGEPLALNNSSSYKLINKIKRKKGILINEYHFLLPYNIHFRYDDNFTKELLIYDYKLLSILYYELVNKIITKIKKNYFYSLNSFIFKIQRLGGPVNSIFYKVDENRCIKCNLCVNNCPVNNIEIKEGKIRFNKKCEMCMRCSFYCPTNAINIGMLENWKVNGKYDLEKIYNNVNLKGDYLKDHNSKFFKMFPKKIKKINDLYDSYFK